MRRITLVMLVFVALASFGACGGGSDQPTVAEPTASTQATGSPSSAAGGIELAKSVQLAKTSLGKVLVDENQHTLYMFLQDTGEDSTCTGACAQTWPALKVATPTAGDGVDSTKLDSNNSDQVLYNGHPLYRYSGDSKPGDTNGEGIADKWFAVSAAGEPVKS